MMFEAAQTKTWLRDEFDQVPIAEGEEMKKIFQFMDDAFCTKKFSLWMRQEGRGKKILITFIHYFMKFLLSNGSDATSYGQMMSI